jgi:hypothetical protein
MGLEWAWRLLSEPRRLGGRYLSIIAMMPTLVAHHAADMRRSRRDQKRSRPGPTDRDGLGKVDTGSTVSAGFES